MRGFIAVYDRMPVLMPPQLDIRAARQHSPGAVRPHCSVLLTKGIADRCPFSAPYRIAS